MRVHGIRAQRTVAFTATNKAHHQTSTDLKNHCSSWPGLHSHPVDQGTSAVQQCSHAEPAFPKEGSVIPCYKATVLG